MATNATVKENVQNLSEALASSLTSSEEVHREVVEVLLRFKTHQLLCLFRLIKILV